MDLSFDSPKRFFSVLKKVVLSGGLFLVLFFITPNLAFAVTGQQVYSGTTNTTWTAPAGVTSVSVVVVGPGTYAGGALSYKNNIAVTPGNTYNVFVAAPSSGDYAYFINTSTVSATFGSNYRAGDGGGNGGDPATNGGGGAGGYTGAGGIAGTCGGNENGQAGAGGGGGGGGSTNQSSCSQGGGGGVGLLGLGSSGSGGTFGMNQFGVGTPFSGGGGGGSGGNNGGAVTAVLWSGAYYYQGGGGGSYGGGKGIGNWAVGTAGPGAVRIIWPGDTRQFPSTNTGNMYDVTWNSATGGTSSGAATCTEGSSVTPTCTPSAGYYVTSCSAFTCSASNSFTPSFSNTYTVTFNTNTGTGGATAAQSLVYNTPTALTSNGFTKTGYSFVNWNTAANGSGTAYANGASYTIGAAGVTLYAQWTINSYTVTFDTNGGDGGATGAESLVYNTPTVLTTNGFTRTGYTYTGWNTAANGLGTAYADSASYTIGAAGVTLYAQWSANTYGVTWNSATGGSSSGVATCTYDTTVTPTCTPSTGYSTASCVAFTCSIANSFTPSFSINSYTVTFNTNTGNGGATGAQSLVYNTPTALTSNGFTKTGYSFVSWNTAADGSGTTYANGASYTIGAAGVTLYAQWTINPYTVTFNTNGGNGGATAAQSLVYNTPTALTANGFTFTGYTFSDWNTAADGSGTAYANGASYTIGAAGVTLYAQWTINTQSALSITSTSVTYPSTLALTTSGGSGSGAVSYAVNSGSCTVLGSTLTPTGIGSCSVTATKAADAVTYLNGVSSAPTTITINPTPQTASLSPASATYNGGSQSATVTCSGGGTPTPAVVSGTNIGTYTTTISCGATGNYALTGSLNPGNFSITATAQSASLAQTTDTDFNGGTHSSTVVTGSGSGGSVSLARTP